MSRWKQWGAFIFLGGLAWGTSFLWIKVALRELAPLTLVAWRMAFGAAGAWAILRLERRPIGIRGRELLYTLLLGLFNTAIPIALISWAELHIDSGLAGILNSTVPLFTIVLAHVFLHDERITWPKALGLAAGFIGVVILLGRDVGAEGLTGSLRGQLAVILAAILYASSNVFIRLRLRDQHPIHMAAVSLTSAFVFMAALALIFEHPVRVPHLPMTWLACGWMGLVGLSLAYYAYFYLLRSWGATRSVLVTYVFPVAAVILGVVFLGERPAWYVFAGGAMVVGGIALVNLKRG